MLFALPNNLSADYAQYTRSPWRYKLNRNDIGPCIYISNDVVVRNIYTLYSYTFRKTRALKLSVSSLRSFPIYMEGSWKEIACIRIVDGKHEL